MRRGTAGRLAGLITGIAVVGGIGGVAYGAQAGPTSPSSAGGLVMAAPLTAPAEAAETATPVASDRAQSLSQQINLTILPGGLTFEPGVVNAIATAAGHTRVFSGTVTNARGSDAAWTLSVTAPGLAGTTVTPRCVVDPTTLIAGTTSAVTSGPRITVSSGPIAVCAAPANGSGGTFLVTLDADGAVASIPSVVPVLG